MNDSKETEYEDELTAIREKIAEAQSAGNSKRANRLYAEEQRIIAQRRGNGPIVDGRRTA